MLFWFGRVMGVSGILSGFLFGERKDRPWRGLFLLGLIAGGVILNWLHPPSVSDGSTRPWLLVISAGLLVGYGSALGSGCTSGHGVCGLSRLSPRSIVATLIFVSVGMLTVWILRHGA